MWFFFALLSAIFAALTSILAKIGIEGVPSNLATAIRTVVVILMAWAMVFLTNSQTEIVIISRKSWLSHLIWLGHWRLLALLLQGLAAGQCD